MTRWTGLALLGLVLGCSVTAQPPAPSSPRPLPSPSLSPTASPPLSLKGSWAVGGTNGEPEPSPSAYLSCPATVDLTQEGDRIDLEGHWACGAASEKASGMLQGDRLRLEGQHFRGRLPLVLVFDLTYHPETGHLTGTRNGKPVWLIPYGHCPSPASLCTVPVEGNLYDEGGALLQEKARMTVKSLNPSLPYENNFDVQGGHYRLEGLVPGYELEFTVEVAGQPKVSRRVTIERGPVWNVNFGGPPDELDPDGWRYWAKPMQKPSLAPSGAPHPVESALI